jgi:hypothetical protein
MGQMKVLRSAQMGAVILALALSPAQARTRHDVKIPLSTAIQLLLPSGSFVAYEGTVDTSELVRLPHRGSKSDRLIELLSAYNLRETTVGSTITIFPYGSPPPSAALPPAPPPVAQSYSSPGFAMAAPVPAPTPVAVIRAVPGVAPAGLHEAPIPAPAAPPPPPPPPEPVWILASGTLMSKDLQAWAPEAGWQVQWQFPRDFVVPATTTLRGQFPEVVRQVVGDLREQLEITDPNNADIHADTYNANRVIIINSVSEANNHAD